MSNRFRNCVITAWKQPPDDSIVKCSYFIGQKERAPSTGKIHYQCYVEFENGKSMKTIKKLFGDDCHIEKRRGTQKQAIDYCKKIESRVVDDAPWNKEHGNPNQMGHRSDLDGMLDMIRAHHGTWDIVDTHGGNGLRHINHIIRAQRVYYGIDRDVAQIDDARNLRLAAERNDMAYLRTRYNLTQREISALTGTTYPEVDGNTDHPPQGSSLSVSFSSSDSET